MIGRDLKDHEVVTALVAGQILDSELVKGTDTAAAPSDIGEAVIMAEKIVAEVVRRSDARLPASD